MSQTKAQLLAPIGIITCPGLDVTVGGSSPFQLGSTGIITAVSASFSGNVTVGGTLTYDDVTNIDSVGLITARKGINVTAGVSTFAANINANGNIVGDDSTNISGINSVTATTYYGSASNLTNLPESGTSITGICSGTMPANRAVCVHSDGKVGVVTGTAALFGSGVEVDTAQVSGAGQEVAYGNNVVVVHYADQANNSYVKAGTISGTTITWGTKVQVSTNEQGQIFIVYNAVASNFIVSYRRDNGGRLKLVTVSGTTCTVGSEVDYETTNGYIENVAMSYDSTAQKAVIAYKEGSTNQVHARVITADSSSISLGTKNSNIFGATADNPWLYYDSVTNKTYVTGQDNGTSSMSFMIGTISGTDITFANKSQPLGTMSASYKVVMVRDTTKNKLIVVGRGSGSGTTDNLYYTLGTWGGSNFTWTTKIAPMTNKPADFRISYNPGGKTMVMVGENNTAFQASYWTAKDAESYEDDPDTLNWSDPKVLSTTSAGEWTSMADIPDGVVMTYASNTGNGANYLHYSIEQFQNSTLNDDGQNFIGFSKQAYTDGQTATIKVVGNVVAGQAGLTTGSDYYIQGDGGLLIYYFSNKNTATNVKAGTAIKNDQLLIR